MGTLAHSAPTWFQASRSLRQVGKMLHTGLIRQRLLSRLENSATRRVTSFAGRAHGRLISAPAKTIPIKERAQLEFRSEFYNIFNHPQLGFPQATCGVSTLNPVGCSAGFGSITNTVNTSVISPITPVGSGTPREIQFALRLTF